jgi:hypothetical protein
MAARRVKGLKKSGRVSVAKARKAVAALKQARRSAGTGSDKAVTVTSAQTATGRHLVSFRAGSNAPKLAS